MFHHAKSTENRHFATIEDFEGNSMSSTEMIAENFNKYRFTNYTIINLFVYFNLFLIAFSLIDAFLMNCFIAINYY